MNAYKGKSPFRYQTDIVVKKVRGTETRGIGEGRMWDFMTSGLITEAEQLIIQLLYELEFITSDMIKQCHMNTLVPPEYKKITAAKKKNPYRHMLTHLESLGIVTLYGLFHEDAQVGVRIHALSPGAQKWMSQQYSNFRPIYLKGVDLYNNNSIRLNAPLDLTEVVLEKLARNQFHIKAVNFSYSAFHTYNPMQVITNSLNTAYYETNSGWELYLLTTRRSPDGILLLQEALEQLLNMIISKKKEQCSCIIIAVETLAHAKELHPELRNIFTPRNLPVFYVTDVQSKSENIVFNHLIHYTSAEGSKFETVSIEVS